MSIEIVNCKSATVTKDGRKYYLLFNKEYELIKPVYKYLNKDLFIKRAAPQTIEKSLIALKGLYSFLESNSLKLENMTPDDAALLVDFLLGGERLTMDGPVNYGARREPTSVNDYLSLIRCYIRYLELKNHPLLEKKGSRRIEMSTSPVGMSVSSYENVAAEYHRTEIPKHVTLDEYITMLNYVRSHNDKRTECIIRLMYESGLRSGEVLALTREDIKKDIIKGVTVYKVTLRDRLGNIAGQHPKFLMHITSKEDYNRTNYKIKTVGWDEAFISQDLYDNILDYINTAHEQAQDEHGNLWKKYAVADIVDESYSEQENYYVFLNAIGKPLSRITLGNNIRDLFMACEIPLEIHGGRKDGLCHRFRHGFAMYQINYNHVNIELLQLLMRHRKLESTAIYYTPTSSDISHMRDEMTDDLYKYIPTFSLTEREQ